MKKTATILFLLISSARLFAQTCVPNASALVFDGFSAYVNQTNNTNLSITGPITVEAWINSSSWGATSAQGSIVCKHGWSSGEEGYVLRAGGNGELSFNIAGVDTNGLPVSWVEVLSPVNSLLLNTWYHVAGTFDGHVLRCYINGDSVGSTNFRGTIMPSLDYSLKIGRIADNQFPERWWNGMIDEVRIWNRALTPAELQLNMNRHLNPIGAMGLLSYWRFNETTGLTAGDLGTSGNTGSLINATWTTIDVPFNNVPATPAISFNGTDLVSSSSSGNQWYQGANLIVGAILPTYTPPQNGTYTVVVTNADSCTASSTPYNLTTLGTGFISQDFSLELWPNPAHDVIQIRLPASIEMLDVSIFSLTGQKILKLQSKADVNGVVVIDSRLLSKGVYCVELSSGPFRTMRKLVID